NRGAGWRVTRAATGRPERRGGARQLRLMGTDWLSVADASTGILSRGLVGSGKIQWTAAGMITNASGISSRISWTMPVIRLDARRSGTVTSDARMNRGLSDQWR